MNPQYLHDVHPQEYVDNLVDVISHARPYEYGLLMAAEMREPAALALVLNPHTRAELWSQLDDVMRGFVLYYESVCVDEESTQRILTTLCHNVTHQIYRQEAEEIVDELTAWAADQEE